MKLKHTLPAYSTLDHIHIDDQLLEQLRSCISVLENDFKSVLEINKGFCGLNHDFTKSVYDSFLQVSLTDSTVENKEISMEECEISNQTLALNGHRNKQALAFDNNSVLNEATYTEKTETYKRFANIFDKIVEQFKGSPTRIRLVKMTAGSNILPHIDYDPSYAVRVIIPIISDNECVNVFWVKNKVETVSLLPGNAYFLNTGYKHAVMNFSKHDRYTFMISVKGTEDIEHLIRK